jgi:heme/copper-type cytochrome/quinol oxidase subunit 2
VVRDSTFKDIGTLFFAFTVFYAYIHFSQYFLIWNAAIPEETFWYVKRENGIWWYLGMLIIFGHFFVPFLTMLRIDVKKKLTIMAPLAGWAWLMHYVDMTFNIKPVIDPEGHGISLSGMIQSIASMAFIGGFLAKFFLKSFITHAPFPQRDPRIAETMGVYVELESEAQAQTKSAKA